MHFSKYKKALIFIGVILLTALGLRFFSGEDNWVCQNGQWVAHGKPALSQPQTPCGDPAKPPAAIIQNNNVRNLSIQPNEGISSPFTLTGEARGSWFFEASFPVILVNWDGLIIAQGIAQAQGDWMTENFVPFTATLTFRKPEYKDNGSLILKKDNPSGLPENDSAIEIPIKFK